LRPVWPGLAAAGMLPTVHTGGTDMHNAHNVAVLLALLAGCGAAAEPPATPQEPVPPSPLAEGPSAGTADVPPDASAPSAWIQPLDVSFETGDAALTEAGAVAVAGLAGWLVDHPEIVRIQVAVHSDTRGAEAFNLETSRRRAGAIRARLEALGVGGDRISAVGYGETCPAGRGTSAAVQAENRRVEVLVLETADGCTGVEVACPVAIEAELVPRDDRKYLPGAEACP